MLRGALLCKTSTPVEQCFLSNETEGCFPRRRRFIRRSKNFVARLLSPSLSLSLSFSCIPNSRKVHCALTVTCSVAASSSTVHSHGMVANITRLHGRNNRFVRLQLRLAYHTYPWYVPPYDGDDETPPDGHGGNSCDVSGVEEERYQTHTALPKKGRLHRIDALFSHPGILLPIA